MITLDLKKKTVIRSKQFNFKTRVKFFITPLFYFFSYLKKNEFKKINFINFYLISFNKENFKLLRLFENIFFLSLKIFVISNTLFQKKTCAFN